MNENFNYKESITNIKANLFDIYENQERIIGTLDEDVKDKYVNQFIEVKDLALLLLQKINSLYHHPEELKNEYIEESIGNNSDSVSESSLEPVHEIDDMESPEQISEQSEESRSISSELEDNSEEVESSDPQEEEPYLEAEEDPSILIDHDNTSEANQEAEPSVKYYLLCEEKDLNFAYVPEEVLKKIRQLNQSVSMNQEVDQESSEEMENDKAYKQDKLPVKGIIVRNDQYMKLALSKHRQEDVLKEAKAYRSDMVRKKRQEEQKVALEQAEVHLDI